MSNISFPEAGRQPQAVLDEMRQLRQQDADWQGGKVWSLVYHIDEETKDFVREAHNMFMAVNGLNPTVFPSLRKFETEVVGMIADLLSGDEQTCGTMTSGGTESIFMAMKTARSWAKEHKPGAKQPEVVLPVSAHPAFDKAAAYLNIKLVHTPLREDFRANVAEMEKAITPNTIMLVCSAPQYPQGVIDPVEDVAALAESKGLLCHVDSCIGGFMLPFLRELGYPIPPFDFAVPGVTSMSADIHKYGYAAKGASTVLYRNKALRRHQFFVYTGWTGGIYASPSAGGTRPGGSIAAAWAIVNHLGMEGYKQLAERTMQTTQHLRQGIESIEGLRVLGDPEMTLLSFDSEKQNIHGVADEMSLRGWHIDRQQEPPNMHLTVMAHHHRIADTFLAELAESTQAARKLTLGNMSRKLSFGLTRTAMRLLPDKWVSAMAKKQGQKDSGDIVPKRAAAMYGMMGELPEEGDLDELILDLMDRMTSPAANGKE